MFANPDGSIVVVIQDDLTEDHDVTVLLGDRIVAATLCLILSTRSSGPPVNRSRATAGHADDDYRSLLGYGKTHSFLPGPA